MLRAPKAAPQNQSVPNSEQFRTSGFSRHVALTCWLEASRPTSLVGACFAERQLQRTRPGKVPSPTPKTHTHPSRHLRAARRADAKELHKCAPPHLLEGVRSPPAKQAEPRACLEAGLEGLIQKQLGTQAEAAGPARSRAPHLQLSTSIIKHLV